MKSNFKVGQTVYCVLFGEGVVSSINLEDLYPIEVEFGVENYRYYTEEGSYIYEAGRTLFFTNPEIQGATEPVFEPQLKEGDKIVSLYKGESVIKEVVEEDETVSVVKEPGEKSVGEYFKKGMEGLKLFKLGEEIKF